MKLTEEIKKIMFAGWCERETMDYDEKEFECITQQIYSNQKLRELIEKSIEENERYKNDPDSGGLYYELQKLLGDSKK